MKSSIFFFFSILTATLFASPFEGLTQLDGSAFSPSTIGKEKVLTVFWATWCPDCKEKLKSELPELDSSKDIAVITINTDRSADRANNFIEKTALNLPVLRDEKKSLRKSLKVFSVPHWAVHKKSPSGWELVDTAPAFEWDRVNKALGRI